MRDALVCRTLKPFQPSRTRFSEPTKTWRLADLGARHEMILAGLGWGSMPMHMVEDDLAHGRLVRLDIRKPGGPKKFPRPGVVLARRKGKVLGPAGTWLAQRLANHERHSADRPARSR